MFLCISSGEKERFLNVNRYYLAGKCKTGPGILDWYEQVHWDSLKGRRHLPMHI